MMGNKTAWNQNHCCYCLNLKKKKNHCCWTKMNHRYTVSRTPSSNLSAILTVKQTATQTQRKGDGGISNLASSRGEKALWRGFWTEKACLQRCRKSCWFPRCARTHICWKPDTRTCTHHEHSHTPQLQYSLPAVPCTGMLTQPEEHGKEKQRAVKRHFTSLWERVTGLS